MKHVFVYKEPGRFAGWPANNGVWRWGDEILVGFELGYYKAKERGHSIDMERPTEVVTARSPDGGETWTLERPGVFDTDTRGIPCDAALRQAQDRPCEWQEGRPERSRGAAIEFTHPGFALRMGGFATRSQSRLNRFWLSYDKGKTWQGPYAFPALAEQLTSRTDYLVNDKHDCLVFLSAVEPSARPGHPDRAFCARTADGGRTFEFVSWMAGEPTGIRSVMPSTVRLSDRTLLSAMRRRQNVEGEQHNWLDVYVSNDDGGSWEFRSKVAETGAPNGNPPSMARLTDGRLCVTYGCRAEPRGIRAKISDDNGATWDREIMLRDDGRSWDLGYTRTVQRPDGKLVTIYYFTTERDPEQHIAATIWDADLAQSASR